MNDAVVAQSQQAIKLGSKSFAAAARLFSEDTRNDVVMLYAWCRHCDDVIDGQTLGHQPESDFRNGQRARLEQLKARTAWAMSGAQLEDPNFEALRRVVSRHGIPERHLQELLDGFTMDVDQRRYETIDDTLEYCYCVAGVVGVMMSMIMGAKEPAVLDRASDLGLAFQLTNIARDVIDDARMGRVYIPAEILARHGVKSVNPDDHSHWPRLHAAALDLLEIADDYYASALVGLSALPPRSAWAIAAARRVYRDIGERLRSQGPDAWKRRVSTSAARKFFLLTASLTDVIASRVTPTKQPRQNLWRRP